MEEVYTFNSSNGLNIKENIAKAIEKENIDFDKIKGLDDVFCVAGRYDGNYCMAVFFQKNKREEVNEKFKKRCEYTRKMVFRAYQFTSH